MEDTTKGPDSPGTLKMHTGKSPMIKLMVTELGLEETHIRAQLIEEIRLCWPQINENVRRLYGTAKTA